MFKRISAFTLPPPTHTRSNQQVWTWARATATHGSLLASPAQVPPTRAALAAAAATAAGGGNGSGAFTFYYNDDGMNGLVEEWGGVEGRPEELL